MNIYLRQVASEGINHHVEHCIFVPASRVLFSSRCPTFRVSLLSSYIMVVGSLRICLVSFIFAVIQCVPSFVRPLGDPDPPL